jgi:hypothetical protein
VAVFGVRRLQAPLSLAARCRSTTTVVGSGQRTCVPEPHSAWHLLSAGEAGGGRLSGGSGRVRLEPAAGAARLMGETAAGNDARAWNRYRCSGRTSGGSGRVRLNRPLDAARLMGETAAGNVGVVVRQSVKRRLGRRTPKSSASVKRQRLAGRWRSLECGDFRRRFAQPLDAARRRRWLARGGDSCVPEPHGAWHPLSCSSAHAEDPKKES